MGILGIIGTLFLAGQQFVLWKTNGDIPSTWYTPIYMPVIFLMVGILVYFFAPMIDFRLNSFWKYTFQLRLLPDRLYFGIKIGENGLKYEWKDAKIVLESKVAYVVFYNPESHFLIVPKRILGENEPYFRERLAQAKFITEKARNKKI